MEEHNDTESSPELEDKYKITSIPEVKDKLGTSSSVLDAKHGHVSKLMTTFWGRPEFYEYTEDLLLYSPSSDRPNRDGFQDDAVSEILLVINLHNALFPRDLK